MRIDRVAADASHGEAPIAQPNARKPERAATSHATRQELPKASSQNSVSTHEVAISFDQNRAIYHILNKETGEVIQQLPPEELLRVMHNIAQVVEQARAKTISARS
jgi:uncharacterized FlaG/YvyC family protein